MMNVAWVWRHPQSVDYLLNTLDARFETIAYLARQNRVTLYAPAAEGVPWAASRSTRPISGMFDVHGLASWEHVLQAVCAAKPDVLICEGALEEAEWGQLLDQCPAPLKCLYYGGGPLWNEQHEVPAMAHRWDTVWVPHRAQAQFLRDHGVRDARKAYGIPSNWFRPLGLPKLYHVFYPANITGGKRNSLVTQYLEQYAPQHLPSLFTGQVEDLNMLDMVRVGGIPMNNPGPPRGQPLIGGRAPQCVMPLLYNVSEVVVYGSQEEGHPNAVFEAMACGTPAVVMSDCAWLVGDACREVEAMFPLAVQVVPPLPGAIYTAVENVVANPHEAATQARVAAVTLYDWWSMYDTIDRSCRTGLGLKQAGQPPQVPPL